MFNLAKARYSRYLDTKMAPHQQAMLVPGISPGKPFTLKEKGARIVKKLDAFFGWPKDELRITGFWPRHFDNRADKPSTMKPGECDMAPGGVAMPAVVDKLQEVGKFIIGNQANHPRRPVEG